VPVIGIVRDAHFTGQARETPPRYIFFSIGERAQPPGGYTFYLRHDGQQQILAPAVKRALRDLQAEIVATNVRSFDTELARRTAPMRMVTSLAAMFAGVSLLIAAIGQYAVVAFNGRRRFREFGLRLALGATNEQVIRSVVAENARATLVGLLIGFVLSLGVGAVLARALYGIRPTDPVTFAGVFALMAAASLIACYLPARRAAAVDRLVALRAE
jgi:putative ABC transport system permease protein